MPSSEPGGPECPICSSPLTRYFETLEATGYKIPMFKCDGPRMVVHEYRIEETEFWDRRAPFSEQGEEGE